jgi:exonuclease-1
MMKNNGDMKKSRNLISQSIDVTPKMAYELIEVIKQHRKTVNIIVAPYEADAQLAFLSLNNIVDAVISEDSDTIPYGCRHVLFKYDNKTGFCQHLDLDNVFKVKEQNLDLTEFDQDMLIAMCVGSGCDYFVSGV